MPGALQQPLQHHLPEDTGGQPHHNAQIAVALLYDAFHLRLAAEKQIRAGQAQNTA